MQCKSSAKSVLQLKVELRQHFASSCLQPMCNMHHHCTIVITIIIAMCNMHHHCTIVIIIAFNIIIIVTINIKISISLNLAISVYKAIAQMIFLWRFLEYGWEMDSFSSSIFF